MKFLITGGSGFIGKKLSEELLKKYGTADNEFVFIARKRKLDFLDKYKDKTKIQIVKSDITDKNAISKYFRKVDYVFHLAARVEYGDYRIKDYYDINVKGVKNIFETCLEHKIKKVIYLSSAVVYHPTFDYYPDEKTEIKEAHVTHYTRSKFLAYKLVERYQSKGLDITTILPSSVFGYGSPLFEPFILQCLKYRFVVLPSKRARLSAVLADDVIKFMIIVIEDNIKNGKYILSDINFSLRDFVKKIENIYSRKIFIILLPNVLMRYFLFCLSLLLRILRVKAFNNYELFKLIDGNFLASGIKVKKDFNWHYSNFDKDFKIVIRRYINKLSKH